MKRASTSSRRPLYLQARDRLLQLIERHDVGSPLPHERELALEWGVSRITIRNAYARLVEEGFVLRTHKAYRPASRLSATTGIFMVDGFTRDAKERGLAPRTEVVEVRVVETPANVASALKLSVGAPCYRLTRRRHLNEKLVGIEHAYVSTSLTPGLERYPLVSLYDVLAKHYHITVHWAEQSFRFSFQRSAETRLLGLGRGIPALHLRRVSFTLENRAVEYVDALYNLRDFEFYVRVRR
jgi:GntR family transcriptional regulator